MVKRVFVAGQEGMVGQAIYKLLKKKKFHLISCKRKDLDLSSQGKVFSWFKKNKPDIVINAAGKVGGILDNKNYQFDYLYINMLIGFNLLKASYINGVDKFINLSSACSYPKKTKQPIKESYLLSSQLESTNEGYAIAKIANIKLCEYLNKKLKRQYISLQPANLYGIGDNFDLQSSHVIPALLRKFHEAKIKKKEIVEVWGSGKVKREFMHADDLARAVAFCVKNKINNSLINVGSPDCMTIKNLALLMKKIVGFKGKIFFNKNYPDGVKNRRLDKKILSRLGWNAKINLNKGLKSYYNEFKKIKIYK
jgi:GDP-L-fucose synthase